MEERTLSSIVFWFQSNELPVSNFILRSSRDLIHFFRGHCLDLIPVKAYFLKIFFWHDSFVCSVCVVRNLLSSVQPAFIWKRICWEVFLPHRIANVLFIRDNISNSSWIPSDFTRFTRDAFFSQVRRYPLCTFAGKILFEYPITACSSTMRMEWSCRVYPYGKFAGIYVPACIRFWMPHLILPEMDSLSAWAKDAKSAVIISPDIVAVSMFSFSK